jgi:hypothetical protein
MLKISNIPARRVSDRFAFVRAADLPENRGRCVDYTAVVLAELAESPTLEHNELHSPTSGYID